MEGSQDVGQLSVATGRRVLSLASTRLPTHFFVSSSSGLALGSQVNFPVRQKAPLRESALRLSSQNGHSRFSWCLAPAARPSRSQATLLMRQKAPRQQIVLCLSGLNGCLHISCNKFVNHMSVEYGL